MRPLLTEGERDQLGALNQCEWAATSGPGMRVQDNTTHCCVLHASTARVVVLLVLASRALCGCWLLAQSLPTVRECWSAFLQGMHVSGPQSETMACVKDSCDRRKRLGLLQSKGVPEDDLCRGRHAVIWRQDLHRGSCTPMSQEATATPKRRHAEA